MDLTPTLSFDNFTFLSSPLSPHPYYSVLDMSDGIDTAFVDLLNTEIYGFHNTFDKFLHYTISRLLTRNPFSWGGRGV